VQHSELLQAWVIPVRGTRLLDYRNGIELFQPKQ
jgi:hypothetical protein